LGIGQIVADEAAEQPTSETHNVAPTWCYCRQVP